MTEKEILNKIIEILKSELNPGKIFLFGSRAKRKEPGHSDFDIAVDNEKVDNNKLREIMKEIDEAAGLFKVDIVFLKSVDEEFKKIILNTGELIYERRG